MGYTLVIIKIRFENLTRILHFPNLTLLKSIFNPNYKKREKISNILVALCIFISFFYISKIYVKLNMSVLKYVYIMYSKQTVLHLCYTLALPCDTRLNI